MVLSILFARPDGPPQGSRKDQSKEITAEWLSPSPARILQFHLVHERQLLDGDRAVIHIHLKKNIAAEEQFDGRRIRELRGFDIIQSEFAQRVGISQSRLSRLEVPDHHCALDRGIQTRPASWRSGNRTSQEAFLDLVALTETRP